MFVSTLLQMGWFLYAFAGGLCAGWLFVIVVERFGYHFVPWVVWSTAATLLLLAIIQASGYVTGDFNFIEHARLIKCALVGLLFPLVRFRSVLMQRLTQCDAGKHS